MSRDPRCAGLAEILAPVMGANAPQGAGGYGGDLQLNLANAEVDAVGGVALRRAAMRRAGRQLGWKIQTVASAGERSTIVLVHDVRESPQPYTHVIEQALMDRAVRRSTGGSTPLIKARAR